MGLTHHACHNASNFNATNNGQRTVFFSEPSCDRSIAQKR